MNVAIVTRTKMGPQVSLQVALPIERFAASRLTAHPRVRVPVRRHVGLHVLLLREFPVADLALERFHAYTHMRSHSNCLPLPALVLGQIA